MSVHIKQGKLTLNPAPLLLTRRSEGILTRKHSDFKGQFPYLTSVP